jgi:hypothetical protein
MKFTLNTLYTLLIALGLSAYGCDSHDHDADDTHDDDKEHAEDHDGHDDDKEHAEDQDGHAEDHDDHDKGHAEEGEHADGEHDHTEKIAGPNGGRVITAVEPHAEFLVTEDRKVQVTFLTEDNKPLAASGQTVSVIAGDRSNPTKLAFAVSGDSLLSDIALPAGNDFPTVVQIKTSPDAKAVIDRFNINLSDCPTCEYNEYACICEHADDDHDHKD